MLTLAKQFLRDDDGLEMVEWAVVGGLLTVAAATGMASVATIIGGKFDDLVTAAAVT